MWPSGHYLADFEPTMKLLFLPRKELPTGPRKEGGKDFQTYLFIYVKTIQELLINHPVVKAFVFLSKIIGWDALLSFSICILSSINP